MSAHTKGAWRAEPSANDTDFIVIANNTGAPLAVTCEDGVAERYRNKEAAEANAKLMAAAPDMLSALQHIIERMNVVRSKDAFCAALRHIAEEAIKKAVVLIVPILLLAASCNTCKHAPTYGGRAAMTQGHAKEAFEQRASANPYSVKAKKIRSHYRNPMK